MREDMFHTRSFLAAAFSAFLLFGVACPASAAFTQQISYRLDNGSLVSLGSTNQEDLILTNINIGELFTISMQMASTNSPGTTTVATIEMASVILKTTNTYTGTHKLELFVSADNYTEPSTGVPNLLSSAASVTSLSSNGTVDISYNGYADTSNALNGTAGSATPTIQLVTDGQIGTGAGPSTTLFDSKGGAYSMTGVITITTSGALNFTAISGNTQVVALPAPPAFALLVSALPVGVLFYLRRRKMA